MKKLAIAGLVAVCGMAFAQSPNTVYNFNNSLAPTVNANGLAGNINYEVSGAAGTATYGSASIFGSTRTYLNVGLSTVLQTPTGLAANGGGSYVNQFTFLELVDPTAATTIYDSTDTVSGNGPEGWINASGYAQTGADGTPYSGNSTATTAIAFNTWQWLAVSVDTVAETVSIYDNGNLLVTNPTEGVDAKEALYTPTYGAYTDFFTNTNLTGVGTLKIAELVAYDTNLTQAQIIAAEAVPEPAPILLLGMGGIVCLLTRKR